MSFIGSLVGGGTAGSIGQLYGSGALGSNPLSNISSIADLGNGGGIDWNGIIKGQQATASNFLTSSQNDISGLKSDLAGVTAPTAVTPEKLTVPTSLPQFDLARNAQAASQAQNVSAANDALSRRFAAMGGGPSGASVKAQNDLSRQEAEANDQAMAKINTAEAETKSDLQSKYDLYNAQSSQQAQEFNSQQAQTYKQFGFQANSAIAQMDLGAQQAYMDTETTAFNEDLQAYQAQHSGGLFGAGGFLGTGIGA